MIHHSLWKQISRILVVAILLTTVGSFPVTNADGSTSGANMFDLGNIQSGTGFAAYLQQHSDARRPSREITLNGTDVSIWDQANMTLHRSFEGKMNVLEWRNESGVAEWNVNVPEPGFYTISMKYMPLTGSGRDIELALSLDGRIPFDGAGRLTFSRVWVDDGAITRDSRGNDLRPRQKERSRWMSADLKDSEGLYNEAYSFYLTTGDHTLRLEANSGELAIQSLRLHNEKAPQKYKDLSTFYRLQGYRTTNHQFIKVQAEQMLEKSHATLYPIFDRSSPRTEPSSPSAIRLNTVGGVNWKFPGQWISWQVEVPEDGLYQLAFKSRQNIARGMASTRKLTIDGQVPFLEALNIAFPYGSNWYMNIVGGKESPQLIYLSKGKHVITLEATLGDIAETVRAAQDAVFRLNELYRKIIKITGIHPDELRDYNLAAEIPGLNDDFNAVQQTLLKQSQRIQKMTGTRGSEASVMDQVAKQLGEFIADPDTIPLRLDKYKQNVGSLGAMLLTIREQPLELDYLIVSSPDRPPPRAKAGFFEKLGFDLKSFFSSFSVDYSSIGGVHTDKHALKVWIASGRDQAQVVKSMIDDVFTPTTGISVNLSIVDAGATLIQATLAGKGPDVAMMTPKETPINLAMRGALVDLSQFEGFEALKKRFFASALVPYEYNGGIFAIPETQNFDMMFYRKDIFAELGIHVPQTWDDFYKVLGLIQKNNMQVGISESQSIQTQEGVSGGIGAFERFLYQNGGRYYNDTFSATAFDEQAAIESFSEWTALYSKYGLDRSFDFYNRFRTSEMPLSLQSYTMYNMLSVAAPEIRGLWGMAPVPGIRRLDGTINRAETARGTGTIMLSGAKDWQAAFDFMTWWTSEETQSRFDIELEAMMGPAARYDTANVAAFRKLPWSKDEMDLLQEQWNQVTDVPQIPGNYYIGRSLTNAFRSVVDHGENPQAALNRYNRDMNIEIERKRHEFGLSQP